MNPKKMTNLAARLSSLLALCLAAPAPLFGDITYTLELDGVDPAIKAQIEQSMAEAVSLYNRRGSFNKQLNVQYNPAVPTADGSFNGLIRFGGARSTQIALHEISHTLGVGSVFQWGQLLSDGRWTGPFAISKMEDLEGPGVSVHGDSAHFWNFGTYTYGLNFDTQDGTIPRRGHVEMVASLRADMGLPSFVEEAESLAVSPGSTAVFSVVYAPGPATYQWFKSPGDIPLTDAANISGSGTDSLTISNANSSDEGFYYCVASGSLASRPARLSVGHWELYEIDGYTMRQARSSESFEIGSEFTTGDTPPTITGLGFVDLNSVNPSHGLEGDGLLSAHKVTLWKTSTGTKVTEVTVPAGPWGKLIGTFRYSELPESSLPLEPNTSYVVSANVTGADAWLDQEVVDPSPHFLGANAGNSSTWQRRFSAPGTFPGTPQAGTYHAAANITTRSLSVMGSTSFFRQTYEGFRNDYTGSVGYEFIPNEDIAIDRLGRAVSNSMNQAHELSLWRVSDQSLIARTTVDASSSVDSHGFANAALEQTVRLDSGTAYRIVSSETSGGDSFRDFSLMENHLDIASITQAAYGGSSGYPANAFAPGQAYGPVTFYLTNESPPDPYRTFIEDQWELTGEDALPGNDYDFDGLPNSIEFVLASDPTSSDRGLAPSATIDPSDMVFTFRRSEAALQYDPVVEYGSDLAGWTEAEAGTDGIRISSVTNGSGPGISTVSVAIPRALAEGGQIFARLKVALPSEAVR